MVFFHHQQLFQKQRCQNVTVKNDPPDLGGVGPIVEHVQLNGKESKVNGCCWFRVFFYCGNVFPC